jgi:glucokinase
MTRLAGFDIGGTNARLGVYDGGWNVVATAKRGTRDILEAEALAALMAEMLAETAEDSIESVGVGIAAQLSQRGSVIANAPNFGWTDIPFAQLLTDALELDGSTPTVRLVNDLSALLWGEYRAGAARGHRNTLAVYVGTGVGGAILADGELVEGAGGKAGEIGHMKVAPGGRACGCGQRGCVEAYAGGAHLESMVREIARDHGLTELSVDDVDLADAESRIDDVDALDALWDKATDYLAVCIANAVTLLNPGALLLGGGVLQNLDDFEKRVLTKTPPLISASAREDLEILQPDLGDSAGMLGAAMLASPE